MKRLIQRATISAFLVLFLPRGVVDGQSLVTDSAFRNLVGNAQIKYDRFERNLSFQFAATTLPARAGDPAVQLIAVVGRRLDQYVGEYGTLLFISKGATVGAETGVRILVDDKSELRIITPVDLGGGSIVYPIRLASWNIDAFAKAVNVELRLPNGAEVVVPPTLLREGSKLLKAIKDSSFVSWARGHATVASPLQPAQGATPPVP